MIGKGERSDAVVSAIKKAGAVYFGAVGGAGALLSACVKEAQVIAFSDLGTEAIRRLVVEDFPVTVIIDSNGINLYTLRVLDNFTTGVVRKGVPLSPS
jgi:fumarate hydratase subunit beta